MPYLGTEPLAGLSARQVAAIEAACRAAPDQSRDGLRRAIAFNLGDLPCSDSIVQAAIHAALFDNDVPTSLLLPHPTAATAGMNGNIMAGGNISQRQLLTGPLSGRSNLGADIVKA